MPSSLAGYYDLPDGTRLMVTLINTHRALTGEEIKAMDVVTEAAELMRRTLGGEG